MSDNAITVYTPQQLTTIATVNDYLEAQDTAEDNPTERIAQAILQAETLDQQNRLWIAGHFKDMDGGLVRIHDWRVMPSDNPGQLRFYLLCDITDLGTGEEGVMTCGSFAAVLQLIGAKMRNLLPADAEITTAKRPAKSGFKPMRLTWVGRVANGEG